MGGGRGGGDGAGEGARACVRACAHERRRTMRGHMLAPPPPHPPSQGAVLASDAFFPFSWGDSVEIACQAGVAAIVHPGGSVRDADAVECCNKYGVVLLTTGVRHFKH